MEKIKSVKEESRIRNIGQYDANELVDWGMKKINLLSKERELLPKIGLEKTPEEFNSGEDSETIG